MAMKLAVKTLLIYVVALSVALAQSADNADVASSAMGSERAKLANQRIQAEAEMRAREEQRRLEEEQAMLRSQQAAARSEMAAAQHSEPGGKEPEVTAVPVPNSQAGASEPASRQDMFRTLEQLKLLGELKDDGYITDEEFKKIKQRILDDQT